MNHSSMRVLLTGAAGGIGGAIATELLQRGAQVLLVDLDAAALRQRLAGPLQSFGAKADSHVANLTRADDRARLADAASRWRGGVNVLMNIAGVSHFRLLDEQPEGEIDLAIAVNLQAPIHLSRLLLPHLQRQPEAHILNMGSVYGAIGFPAYSVYAATKFGIHGFSESLRRELADTAVRVHYLAPRATRTGINTPAVEQMNAELRVAMDTPAAVAAAACDLLASDRPEAVLGWPEKLFVRINGLLPRVVDGSLRKKLPIVRRYAGADSPSLISEFETTRTVS